MSKTPFRFKRFSIVQERSAMKIGTDGVLLGAWAAAENPKRILDIGTGTGLISLMLAQRFSSSEITGIEIEKNAFEEARFNISESVFKERCSVIHLSLQEFDSEENFDLIVCNPPFFESTHKKATSRNIARQQSELTFEELIYHSEKLLAPAGKLAVIIPFESEKLFVELASRMNLFPEKITRVRGNEKALLKRSLMLFSRTQPQPEIDELVVEISRNIYTRAYINLTRDFYLKM